MGVRTESEPSWRHSAPARILEARDYYPAAGIIGRSFDISPDGLRFLMIKEGVADTAGAQQNRVVFVQNWSEELKRLVPAK